MAAPGPREHLSLLAAGQPWSLGCGQHSGLGEAGARDRRISGTEPARFMHASTSGVHKLWTKLLITWGARGVNGK